MTAGASLGFLFHNFHPASVFMGDSGSNLLGYLLGVVTASAALKTNAVVALVVPLVILAVPFLDTGFVVAKRLKYRRKPWTADANHFHHRMARIGFSQRKTVPTSMPGRCCWPALAVALRFVPYHHAAISQAGRRDGGARSCGRGQRLPRLRPGDLQVQDVRGAEMKPPTPTPASTRSRARVRRDLETGEFERVG